MEREQEQQLYRLQAELCQTLSDPTRIEILYLLGDTREAVKELIEATGQRQAKISQRPPLEPVWQVVEDETTDHDIEGLIREGQLLCRLDPEINGQVAAPGLLASAGNHLGGGIDAASQFQCEDRRFPSDCLIRNLTLETHYRGLLSFGRIGIDEAARVENATMIPEAVFVEECKVRFLVRQCAPYVQACFYAAAYWTLRYKT